MRSLFRLVNVNLIAIVAGILVLSSSSFTCLVASAAAAPTAKEDANEATKHDPLISKLPNYLAWYRSHGGIGKL